MLAITNTDEFVNAWNIMGPVEESSNIPAVVINTHGYHEYLIGKKLFIDAGVISNLEDKSITSLILYGCNAGHLDYATSNPAYHFAQKVNGGVVLAADGTADCFTINYNYYFTRNDPSFKRELVGGKRGDQGWIMYNESKGLVTTSKSIGECVQLSWMVTMTTLAYYGMKGR